MSWSLCSLSLDGQCGSDLVQKPSLKEGETQGFWVLGHLLSMRKALGSSPRTKLEIENGKMDL